MVVAEVVKEEEEEEEEEGSSKEDKIVTATKKGAAVLDQGISDQIKAHYHVLQQASLCSENFHFQACQFGNFILLFQKKSYFNFFDAG